MIHRFIENIPRELRPIWPFQVTQAGILNLQSVWLAGGAMTSVRLGQTLEVIDGVTFIGDPNLSPDETEVVYSLVQDPSGATPVRSRVQVAQADDLSAVTVVVTDPDQPYSSSLSIGPSWSPDGTMIVFASYATTIGGNAKIKRVNRDGTGLTTLHTLTGGRSNHQTYSPSGDYIVFNRRDGDDIDAAQIWVMEDDGTNATKIHDSTNAFVFGEASFPAWKRNSDVLAWYDPGVGFKKCNADGTSKTTILADTTNTYRTTGIYSWLSDDSALATMNTSTGALVLVDGAGGGVTTLAPTGLEDHHVWVAVTSQENRIYYSKQVSGARVLYSSNESGGDERVEHDQTASSPAAVHHGIYGRNVN